MYKTIWNKSDLLRRYLNPEEVVTFKLVYEFLYSLKDGQEYLKEPHKLENYLEKIEFKDNFSFEELEESFEELSSNFFFIKESLELLRELDIEVLNNYLSIDDIFQQKVDRGQFLEIALEIIDMNTKIRRASPFFSTPEEIGDLLNQILKVKEEESCTDICYGLGGLALKCGTSKINGYEINENFASMGSFLLKVANKDGEIKNLDSLKEELEAADVMVTNPPYGLSVYNLENKDYLKWGKPGKSGDFYFLSQVIDKARSRGAIILPEGSLFRGGKEAEIRANLLKEGYIEGIISLPGNLIPYTAIATSIILFNKEKRNDKVFMLDAKESFNKVRGGVIISQEKLSELSRIYTNFEEINGISKFISVEDLLKNDGTLTVNRYVEIKAEKKDLKSIEEEMKKALSHLENYKEISNELLMKI